VKLSNHPRSRHNAVKAFRKHRGLQIGEQEEDGVADSDLEVVIERKRSQPKKKAFLSSRTTAAAADDDDDDDDDSDCTDGKEVSVSDGGHSWKRQTQHLLILHAPPP